MSKKKKNSKGKEAVWVQYANGTWYPRYKKKERKRFFSGGMSRGK